MESFALSVVPHLFKCYKHNKLQFSIFDSTLYGKEYFDTLSVEECLMIYRIFQCYKDHNFQVHIIKSSLNDREFLMVLSPDEMKIYEESEYSKSIRRIEQFDDLPEIYYRGFVNSLCRHLGSAF